MQHDLLAKLARSFRTRGLLETAKICAKNLTHEVRWYLDRRFDRKYGTETSGRHGLDQLHVDSNNAKHGVYYEATPTRIFRSILQRLSLRYEDFLFVDFGSGKGRTLLLASELPFRRIIGVEFSDELHRIAEQNIRVYLAKTQKDRDIRSICMDAVAFEVPDEPAVLFFYNPFDEELMQRVAQNIKQSYERCPRDLVVVYYNPLSGKVFEELGVFPHQRSLPLPFDLTREYQRSVMIYST